MSEPAAGRNRARRAGLTLAGFVLRILVSAALLWWLIHQLRGGLRELTAIHVADLWAAASVFALSTVAGALQWTLILRHAGLAVSWQRLQRLYWVGLFCNNFLPSSVGGDLVKVADVGLSTGRFTRSVAGTLLDRMLGLVALVGLAFAAGFLLGGARPAGLPWWLLAAIAFAVLGLGAALFSGRLARQLVRWIRRAGLGHYGERFARVAEELQAYRSAPYLVLRLVALALSVQGLRVLTHVLVAHAMGIPLDLQRILQLYVLVPVLGIAIVAPVSFNGLGIREIVATRLMPEIGIAAESAFAMQVATYLVQLGVSLAGGAIFLFMMARGNLVLRRGRRPRAIRPADAAPAPASPDQK